jgi:hypothetical protein
MKYMLLTYLDENAWLAMSDADRQKEMAKCEPHVRRLVASGQVLDGAPLHPTATATTIRVKRNKRLVTDGPFAETREQLGGYTLIEAANLDEAIEVAAGFLGEGSMATIEVRPVVDYRLPAIDTAGRNGDGPAERSLSPSRTSGIA